MMHSYAKIARRFSRLQSDSRGIPSKSGSGTLRRSQGGPMLADVVYKISAVIY